MANFQAEATEPATRHVATLQAHRMRYLGIHKQLPPHVGMPPCQRRQGHRLLARGPPQQWRQHHRSWDPRHYSQGTQDI